MYLSILAHPTGLYPFIILVLFSSSSHILYRQQEQEKTGMPKKDAEGTGTVIGTPGFISPEVLNGERTEKCDVYSLGVTAMFLLTGVNPTKIRGGVHNWKRAIDISRENPELVQVCMLLFYPPLSSILFLLH